ncbi:2-oxoacid:acceptor oxidoreductase family protein [Candidatus Eisenbacteria bacterium]|uniref:2-oxoacid:acceptor oxidoreductase family protein n=1 Tax=Eiseniibacteriota bacterium TaxID=2212470 RepID=A0ABV6YQ04_UNCEI
MKGATPSRKEVRFTGYGGQGMVVMGLILGRAATVHDGKYATMTQSYGPEARGGASSTQCIISPERIFYPYVIEADVLVGMSQAGYDKHRTNIKDDGKLLYDEDLVTLSPEENTKNIYVIPATRFAEELGRKIVANIVMLGFFAGLTDFVSDEAIRKAIEESVPKPTIALNMKAFEKGRNYALSLLEGSAAKA